jgi:hypothetical protein
MRNLKILLLLLLIAPMFLMDCTRIETVKYDEVVRPTKPDDYQIEVYTEAGAPREYKVIGTIYVEANMSNPEIVKKIKSEARKIGADAIVNMKNYGPSGMKQHWGATAIVWTDKESD